MKNIFSAILSLMILISNIAMCDPTNPFTLKPEWSVQHDPFVVHAIPKCGVHISMRTIQLMLPKSFVYLIGPWITHEQLEDAENNHKILFMYNIYYPRSVLSLIEEGYKQICVIRDFRDALCSHCFYMRKFPDSQVARDFFRVNPGFNDLSFDEQIKTLIFGHEQTQSYVEYYFQRIGWALDGYGLPVKYEDLIGENRTETIKKIAAWINLDLTPDHLAFIEENLYAIHDYQPRGGSDDSPEAQAYKPASTGNWKNYLTQEHIEILKPKVGQLLIQLGYEKDLDW